MKRRPCSSGVGDVATVAPCEGERMISRRRRCNRNQEGEAARAIVLLTMLVVAVVAMAEAGVGADSRAGASELREETT